MDSQWRDWAVFDWGRDWGKLPCKIWGFVDLRALEADSDLHFADCDLTQSVYAIVESTTFVDDPHGDLVSDLLRPVQTTVADTGADGHVKKLKFYLADVEAIVSPAVVVPDIGGPKNQYWWIKGCAEWAKIFTGWLDAPHHDDIISDDESSDDDNDSATEEGSASGADNDQSGSDSDTDGSDSDQSDSSDSDQSESQEENDSASEDE
jgi:hypothetical protein